MLPPRNRLQRTRDHQLVARLGARGAGEFLVVHVLADDAADRGPTTRAGFIVGRTVGRAVMRNAVRRRLRHLMRDRLDRVPAGSFVVIRARSGAGTASNAVLAHDLDTALARALVSGRHAMDSAGQPEVSVGRQRGGRR